MDGSPIRFCNDWNVVRLADICTKIGSGATPKGGQQSYLEKRENYSLVRSQNVFDRSFSEDGLAYISDEQARGLRGAELQPDDLLLNITGDGVTFARSCRVPQSVLPACVNQHVSIIRLDTSKAVPGYILSYLTHPCIKEYIESFNAGGSRRAITKGHIESFMVPLPDLETQHAISHILGTLDDKIELNRRINTTLESMAQALFKSWFVDFYPVIDNALAAGNDIPEPLQAKAEKRKALGDKRKPLPDGLHQQFPDRFVFTEEMGWVPEGWDVVALSELATKIGSGATPRGGQQVYVESGTSLIRSQNVYDSEFVWAGLARINDAAAEQLKNVVVEQGDVLLNITGASILRTCVVELDVLPARVNQHVAIIRAEKKAMRRYLHLHLLDPRTKNILMSCNAGASREAVTKSHIESVPTVRPGDFVLDYFAGIVEPLDQRQQINRSETRALVSLRDTLLPKLLSGELRIPEVEKQIAEAV